MSALDDYRRFSLTISGFKTTHEARVILSGLDAFRLYANDAIDELKAKNKRVNRDYYKAEEARYDVVKALRRAEDKFTRIRMTYPIVDEHEGRLEAEKELAELKVELAKSNTFIELLKGMVEQLEDGEFGEYDLGVLKQRTKLEEGHGVSDHRHSTDPLRNHGYSNVCSCGAFYDEGWHEVPKRVEVKGAVTEGRKFVKAAMAEGVKFVISTIVDDAYSPGGVVVTLISVGREK